MDSNIDDVQEFEKSLESTIEICNYFQCMFEFQFHKVAKTSNAPMRIFACILLYLGEHWFLPKRFPIDVSLSSFTS